MLINKNDKNIGTGKLVTATNVKVGKLIASRPNSISKSKRGTHPPSVLIGLEAIEFQTSCIV